MSETALATVSEREIDALKKHSVIISKSGLVPAHFQKSPEAIYTAAAIARSIGEDPVQLMQACYFVGGKMGLASAYLLGRLRRTGAIRGTVRYLIEGEGETLSVRAQATDADTGEEITGPAASYEMAKADGWTKNPKYKTMPEIMLRNRALSFLVRYHYPDVTAGLPTADELRDVEAAERAAVRTGALAAIEAECEDTDGVDELPEDESETLFGEAAVG